ncbi:hypothetical protein GDO81_021525 [Engystomops pustulosus]|uniref:Uncharacterized protein n=1 Tax=Engystomops pustulosus TaxID=76066 RepID=A0AAV6YP83_ENGPU|nr:hypothetical protein GDO81_021525 [Engystomops pustulosus]
MKRCPSLGTIPVFFPGKNNKNNDYKKSTVECKPGRIHGACPSGKRAERNPPMEDYFKVFIFFPFCYFAHCSALSGICRCSHKGKKRRRFIRKL